MREAVVTGFAWTVGAAGLVWGTMFLLLGAPGASVYPFGFSLLTAANVFVYRVTARVRLFAWVELLLILVTPFLLCLHLGGFTPSGAVVLWSSLAPLGAMMVLGRREGALMFGGFIVAVLVSIGVQGRIGSREPIPPLAVELMAFLDVVAVSGAAVVVVRRFVGTSAELERQRLKLRDLERAYLSQELVMRQQERLATLGRLSAGVAHELNNPAAAASRATQRLDDLVGRISEHPPHLLDAGLTSAAVERLTATRGAPPDSPLERSDRAEALATWLESFGDDDPWTLAEALAEIGFDLDSLLPAAEGLRPDQTVAALRLIADTGQAHRLLEDVRRSANRISQVVDALKGYSHMDRAGEHLVDVVAGIEDTLLILATKLDGVTVRRSFEPDLPRVWGNAGELNEAWTNLIANAAEAGAGVITLRALRAERCVRVEVEDDGPGIPASLVERVFDPFVTTKAPGEGTGLGLNVVHRTITERHGGSITVRSRPGCTNFRVTLPVRDRAGVERT